MKYDKIVAISQEKSKKKVDIAKKEIEKMLGRKERISVTSLVKYTGFAKSFFYSNPEIKKAIDDALLQQGECYNPKKVIFDNVLEEKIISLKSIILKLKKAIKELEEKNKKLEKTVEELTQKLEEKK